MRCVDVNDAMLGCELSRLDPATIAVKNGHRCAVRSVQMVRKR